MKRLELTPAEVRTLRDMGIFHSHPRTRMRAQAIVRLSQGLTLQQVANEFAVHLNCRALATAMEQGGLDRLVRRASFRTSAEME